MRMASLSDYKKKRRFSKTPEPGPEKKTSEPLQVGIQEDMLELGRLVRDREAATQPIQQHGRMAREKTVKQLTKLWPGSSDFGRVETVA